MIAFNGIRAINGVIWGVPIELKTLADTNRFQNNSISNLRKSAPEFGVYDPGSKFSGSKYFNSEQLYFSWINPNVSSIRSEITRIYSSNRTPVITIEPWNGNNDEKNLLADIVKGKYDTCIDKTIKILSEFSGRMYISWGHEMDQDLTKRYPWSGKDPESYILAYRYIHDKLNKTLNNKIMWIWAPVVKQGCEKYWPGSEYVDFIGIPIYSYPVWDKSYYGHIRSFKSWYDEKYALIKKFQKPIIIVELGVTGSSDYQTFWLQEAFQNINNLPSVEMILFFYAADISGSWGEKIETPDWRTDSGTVIGLIKWIKNEY